jgi:hypothetical protein
MSRLPDLKQTSLDRSSPAEQFQDQEIVRRSWGARGVRGAKLQSNSYARRSADFFTGPRFYDR